MARGGELPKVVLALTYLLHFLGLIFAAVAFPVQIYLVFVVSVFGKEDLWKNRGVYASLWFVRFILSILAIPLWAAPSVLAGYFLFVSTQQIGVAVGSAVGIAVGLVIGMIYIAHGWPEKVKTIQIQWTSNELNMGLFMVILNGIFDFVAFVAFLLCLVLFWRIPFLAIALCGGLDIKSWRIDILRNLLFGVIDLLLLPCYLLNVVFLWNLPDLLHKFHSNFDLNSYDFSLSIEVRLEAIHNAFWGFVEAVLLLCAFIVFLLVPWRFYFLFQKIFHDNKSFRQKILEQILEALIDILLEFMFLFIIATVYRAPLLFYAMYHQNSFNDRRDSILLSFGIIWLEILMLPFFLLVLLTGYRVPKAIEIWKDQDNGWRFNGYRITIPQAQFKIIEQGFYAFLDIPFILMALIVTLLIWRAYFMWLQILNPADRDIRTIIAYHFALLFLDILQFPVLIFSLVILLTLWRAYAFIKEVKAVTESNLSALAWSSELTKRNEIVLVILWQSLLWLLDIPTTIVFLILMLTIYRAKSTVTSLVEFSQSYFHPVQVVSDPPSPSPHEDPEENPLPKASTASSNYSWHTIVWREFAYLLLDLPLLILAIFTLWRLPWLMNTLINECENAAERRVAVLSTLFKTLKDVFVAVLLLFIVLSWRLISFIKLVKEYQRGDDEHLLIMKLFLEYLKDLPFFLFYLLSLPFIWRSIPITYLLVTIDKEDPVAERRKLVFFGLLVSLADVLFAVLTIIACCFVWRIPDIIAIFKAHQIKHSTPTPPPAPPISPASNETSTLLVEDPLLPGSAPPPVREESSALQSTFNWYKTISHIILVIIADLLSIVQLILIHAFILRIPSLYQRVFLLLKAYADPNGAPIDTTSRGKKGDYAMSLTFSQDNEGVPGFSFSSLRYVLISEFLASLRDLPHILLLPIKALGLVFIPIHLFLAWQVDSKGLLNQSFLSFPLKWLISVSSFRLSFWGLHHLFILYLVVSIIIIPLILSLLPLSINILLIFLATLGDPAWKGVRETFGWYGLGTGDGCCGVFDTVLLILNILWTPILLFAQFVILFIPIWIAVIFTLSPTSITDYFLTFFTQSSIFWGAVGRIPVWVWPLFAIWVVAVLASIQLSVIFVMDRFTLFNPITAFLWVLKKVLAGKLFGMYKSLLGIPTQWAYKHRQTCGCIGEIVIAPIVLIWTFWPAIIPCVIQIYWNPQGWYFWILSGLMIIAFAYHGLIKKTYAVVRVNWAEVQKIEVSPFPKIEIASVKAQFPFTGGFELQFSARRTDPFSVEQALLFIEGSKTSDGSVDPFWAALNTIVGAKQLSMGKMAMYPVKLVPKFLTTEPFRSQKAHKDLIKFTLGIPGEVNVFGKDITMSTDDLTKCFESIVSAGDPEVEFIVEYTSRPIQEGPYKKHGTLLKLKTRFSSILDCKAELPLLCTVMTPQGEWVSPSTDTFLSPPPLSVRDEVTTPLEDQDYVEW